MNSDSDAQTVRFRDMLSRWERKPRLRIVKLLLAGASRRHGGGEIGAELGIPNSTPRTISKS